MIKKSRLINIRIEDQLLDEIEILRKRYADTNWGMLPQIHNLLIDIKKTLED